MKRETRKKVADVVNDNIVINRAEEKKYFSSIHSNVDMFQNNVATKVAIVNMSKLQLFDVMSMSRVAIFRKAVRLDLTFNEIVRLDVLYYSKTNDRSTTRKANKKANLYDYCIKDNRTSSQLRDVLKEKNIVSFLNDKYNLKNEHFTVSEYKKLVK